MTVKLSSKHVLISGGDGSVGKELATHTVVCDYGSEDREKSGVCR